MTAEMDAETRVEKVLAELTLDEKALLTAGADMWNTPSIERLGLPGIRVTDGPNGARGSALLGAGEATAVCIPCGSALGACFDSELVERVGRMLGQEARTKAARVLLAPTINLHRSPLGGRNFECYSEDPLLSGKTAAAFIRGVQAEGVATTPKHFVANDAEFERHTMNSVVDERTLRELYLLPFELAVKEGGALGLMTAYNRVNGVYCGENRELLTTILREQWGFEGFIVTDWFAVGSTDGSAEAGLDLQMPGGGRFFGPALAEAVRAGEVDAALLDAQVERMLRVWDRLGALSDSAQKQEQSVDLPEHRALAREAARESIVLLRNDGVLPLAARELRSVALIGPNADRAQIMGGGSAALRPHYRTTPLEALRARLGDAVEILHRPGCLIERTVAPMPQSALTTPEGEPGLALEFFDNEAWRGEPVRRSVNPDGRILYAGAPGHGVPLAFSLRASGRFTPTVSRRHTFTLLQGGRARLCIDGQVVLDGIANPPPRGEAFFRMGSQEIEARLELEAGRPVEIAIEYCSEGAILLRGVQIGHRPPLGDDPIADAVLAARDADAVVLVVGTNDDWESEGHDRSSMDLPGDQDELIRRVCAANPRTIVCVNTGGPVTMDWADETGALLQIWFGGQEMANALVDVLLGDADPGGRLPTTLPICLEHGPAFGNFPGENSELRYGEGLLVGYRWYDTRRLPVRFPFGHGLSYGRFELGEPRLSQATLAAGERIGVEVAVDNVGGRAGSEVVQCYVAAPKSRLFRARMELRAFAKIRLEPGCSGSVHFELDARALAYWDPCNEGYEALRERLGPAASFVPAASGDGPRREPGWYVDAGRYELRIGRSCADTPLIALIEVPHEIGPIAP